MSKEKSICFLISHGDLARELGEVAQKFFQEAQPLYCYSNEHLSVEEIVEGVSAKLRESLAEHAYIFVDLMGGSCWQAALRIKKDFNFVSVISGMNVPVIVSFAMNCPRMGHAELIKKLEEDAKKGIRVVS